MKVCGCMQRGVSMTKQIIVGKVDANASVMMAPEADQVKISIWPGVSATMYCGAGSRFFSHSAMTCLQQSPRQLHCTKWLAWPYKLPVVHVRSLHGCALLSFLQNHRLVLHTIMPLLGW